MTKNNIFKQQEKKKEVKYRKELLECSEKGVEISQECKDYYKKQLQPFDTEHINNTIATLQYRIEGTTQDTSPPVQEHEMTWGKEYE